jgi:hypothetical protein
VNDGLCNTCDIPQMLRCGDGVNEPLTEILYCKPTDTEVFEFDQPLKCIYYQKEQNNE